MKQAVMGETFIPGFGLDLSASGRRLRPGRASQEHQDIRRAERDFRKRIQQDPGDAVAHYMLGVLLSAQRRHEEAEREYREVIELRRGAGFAMKAS